jgi:hypothetical protein
MFIPSLASSQSATMKIHLADGSEKVLAIDDIRKMHFFTAGKDSYTSLRVNLHWDGGQPDWFGDYPTFEVELSFRKNAAGERILQFWESESYRLLTTPIPFEGPTAPVDSITFYEFKRDSNIQQFEGTLASSRGPLQCSAWIGNKLYAGPPLAVLNLAKNAKLPTTGSVLVDSNAVFVSANPRTNKLLFVASKYAQVSLGSLYEYDINQKSLRCLDSSGMVSSALYSPDDEDVYLYSYGSYDQTNNPAPMDAGYYRVELSSGKRQLVQAWISEIGPSEGVNGFDIHPNGKQLLIPLIFKNRAPLITTTSLESGDCDTLPIAFSEKRICLWLRYDSVGSRILYSNFPPNVVSYGTTNVPSEVGIIHTIDHRKEVIPIVPESSTPWVSLFPAWSSDGRYISFAASPIATEPPGDVSQYRLCVLKLLP